MKQIFINAAKATCDFMFYGKGANTVLLRLLRTILLPPFAVIGVAILVVYFIAAVAFSFVYSVVVYIATGKFDSEIKGGL